MIRSIYALERARWRYANDLRWYDGPQIIYEAAEKFAGASVALVIEGFMEKMREIILDDVRERAAAERQATTETGGAP
jgi:hypothetical protein